MAFRFNVIIFLLLTAGLVLSAPSKNSGNSRKKKPSPPKLSENIDENPFLQDHFMTTVTPDYQTNPFLSVTPKPQEEFYENGSEDYPTRGKKNSQSAMENQETNVAVYIRNPFLQGSSNVLNSPFGSIPNITSNIEVNSESESQSDSLSSGQDSDPRTTSDLKCDEYGRLISGTTQVLSLVGTNSGVIKVDNEKCRKSNRLVIGGTAATSGEFPHMVALGARSVDGAFIFSCGGTLISPEWVLTAAHCTYGPNRGITDARVGFHNLKDSQHGITAGISRIIRHPSYRPPAMYADIALLKLNTVITFNREVRPACLYQQYDTVPTQAWVSGWGVTEFGGEQSDQLQKALLDTIDNIACTIKHNRSIAVPYGVTPSMICAGDRRGGWNKDTCQGDSGGPLQTIHPKNLCLFQVIGITSFGQGCAIVDSPGVYTRVSHYLNWIEDIVWPEA